MTSTLFGVKMFFEISSLMDRNKLLPSRALNILATVSKLTVNDK